jgi:hypothetical protein
MELVNGDKHFTALWSTIGHEWRHHMDFVKYGIKTYRGLTYNEREDIANSSMDGAFMIQKGSVLRMRTSRSHVRKLLQNPFWILERRKLRNILKFNIFKPTW